MARRIRWGMRRVPRRYRARLAWTILRRSLSPGLPSPLPGNETPARIIFVCHGNIMRSAFAAAYWMQQVGTSPSHARRIPAVSAGTDAREGRHAHPMAIASAHRLDVSLEDHRATPLCQVTLRPGDLLVGFDLENMVQLEAAAKPVNGVRVLLLGDCEHGHGSLAAEVRDPWGTSDEATTTTFRRISDLLERLAAQLLSRDDAGHSGPNDSSSSPIRHAR